MRKIGIGAATALLAFLFACGTGKMPPAEVALIPEPLEKIPGNGLFYLKPGSTVSASAPLMEAARDIAAIIEKSTGLKLEVLESGRGDITLDDRFESDNPEAYLFEVGKEGIHIDGATVRGVLMGAATLQQLLPADAADGAVIEHVVIRDEPYFKWRGMHMDVARHFFTLDEVKQFLDILHRYKFNKFHWHLTDDQGWRIEIKKYPLLTEKGAYRHFDRLDRICQRMEKEQGNPDFRIPESLMRIHDGDTIYGGFFTQEQVREVVGYAAARGIDVVPEIDMPGHFSATMSGYPWISCSGEVEWTELFACPLCPGKDEVIGLCKDIWTEVVELFPYEYVHIGGDEVDKSFWKRCPNCAQRIKALGLKDYDELQSWFIHEMEAHLSSLGKKMIGWDEILEGGLSKTATIQWWRNWAPDAVWRATDQGNSVFMSPAFTLYFDGYESGAGTIENVFNYNPLVPHVSAEMARNVYHVDPAHVVLSPEQQKLVLGVQANMWAETIPTFSRMQYQMMPRMMALAEIAWRDPFARRDWNCFRQRYLKQIDYLDSKGINYYIPEITGVQGTKVFADTVTVSATSPMKNITLRYTLDGSLPDGNSQVYFEPFVIDRSTVVTFRPFRPNGTSGQPIRVEYRKENYAPAVDADSAGDGLRVEQYEYRGQKADEVPNGRKIRQFVQDTVGCDAIDPGYVGLVFSGYFEVPADDIYTFVLTSDDGSILYIDDAEVVNNDGNHSATSREGQKALGRGLHKIRVEYYDGNNGGMARLRFKGNGDDGLRTLSGFKH